MKLELILAVAVLCAVPGAAAAKPLITNPAMLNIGFVCRWHDKCMDRQEKAMKRALRYVKKAGPPVWKVQQCNRNASRQRMRVDWIGFYNCIRNPRVRPLSKRR